MSPARAVAVAALVVAIGAVTAGCSSHSSKTANGNAAPFNLKDAPVQRDRVDLVKSYKFEPRVIKVQPGTKVTWTNHDDFPHTVQILAGADPAVHDIGLGKTVEITFDRPGTVYYQCSLHPAQMKGEVIVAG